MSFATLLVHDVTIVTPDTTVSRYDDDLKDWDNATREDVKGWVSQTSRTEVLGDQETPVSDWILYLFPDADIDATCRIEFEGVLFEVSGPPNHAWTPRGEHHIEASLRALGESPQVDS